MLSLMQKEMLHLHACLLLQYQHPKEAVVILKSLILSAPDFIPAQYSMALASLEANDLDAAIDWSKNLLDRCDKTKKAALYLCLSRALWRKGNSDKAKEAYKHYLVFSKKNNETSSTTNITIGGNQ